MESEASSPTYSCPLCHNFVVLTYKLWMSHLRHVHSHDSNFHVVCGVDSCPRTFRVFATLYSHVYRSHRYMLERREKTCTDYTPENDPPSTSSECLLMDATSTSSEGIFICIPNKTQVHKRARFVWDQWLHRSFFGLYFPHQRKVGL